MKERKQDFAEKIVYLGNLFHLEKVTGGVAEYVAEERQDCLPSFRINGNLYGYYEHTGLIERSAR